MYISNVQCTLVRFTPSIILLLLHVPFLKGSADFIVLFSCKNKKMYQPYSNSFTLSIYSVGGEAVFSLPPFLEKAFSLIPGYY
jgi:hypothetical protein